LAAETKCSTMIIPKSTSEHDLESVSSKTCPQNLSP
jgi:hypothetical protein